MAVSIEKNATYSHMIESDGYDLGRDNLVSRANSSSGTSNAGVSYKTSVQMVSGLLPSGSAGINHGISVDGLVAVLTVSASGSQRNNGTAAARCVLEAHFSLHTWAEACYTARQPLRSQVWVAVDGS